MEAVKAEYVRWTRSSTGFVLLMFSLFSSITFLIWSISLSKCGTLLDVVPLDWLSGAWFLPSPWLWSCSSPYASCRCLLRWISLVSSWFWQVNSTIAAAMDCTWKEDGCMAGVDWRSRCRWLEAFLLFLWPGLVALDLVWTIAAFLSEKGIVKLNKV